LYQTIERPCEVHKLMIMQQKLRYVRLSELFLEVQLPIY